MCGIEYSIIFQVKDYDLGFFTAFYFGLDTHSLKWLDLFVVFPWKIAELVSGKSVAFLCRCNSLPALLLLEGLYSKVSQKYQREEVHCQAPAAYQGIWGWVHCHRSPRCHCSPHLLAVQHTSVLVLTREEQRTGQLRLPARVRAAGICRYPV